VQFKNCVPFDKDSCNQDFVHSEGFNDFEFSEDNTVMTYDVSVLGTGYKKDKCVIIIAHDHYLKVGIIKMILIQNQEHVVFISAIHHAFAVPMMGVYELVPQNHYLCHAYASLADYCPLETYRIHLKDHITLKHDVRSC
jgi:hypothetical protein